MLSPAQSSPQRLAQLGGQHAGQDQPAAQPGAGGQRFAAQGGAPQRGEHRLGDEDERRVRGAGETLSHGLGAEGKGRGQQPREDGGEPDGAWGHGQGALPEQRDQAAEQGHSEQLHGGQTQGVGAGGEDAGEQDVQSHTDGAAQHQQVAAVHREVHVEGKKRQTGGGQQDAQQRGRRWQPPPEQRGQQGHEDHREASDEGGLGRRGVLQAGGLETVAGEEEEADEGAGAEA